MKAPSIKNTALKGSTDPTGKRLKPAKKLMKITTKQAELGPMKISASLIDSRCAQ